MTHPFLQPRGQGTDQGTDQGTPTPALTRRDLLVVTHLAEGDSTAGIAAALSVSSNTARTRIRRVQRKLAVDDRDAAVRAARELVVLPTPRPASDPSPHGPH